jgi:hypothetical protein
MKYLGLILLFAGFIALGLMRFVLPGITGEELSPFPLSTDTTQPSSVTFRLAADDAPVHLILEELYFADSNLNEAAGPRNEHIATVEGPGDVYFSNDVVIKPSHWADDQSLVAGRPYISTTTIALLEEVAEGDYTLTLNPDLTPDMETRNLQLEIRTRVFVAPPYAELAAFGAMFAGIGVLILAILSSHRNKTSRQQPASSRSAPRFGRRSRD